VAQHDTRNPWDRRDDETDKAFKAFKLYRDQGEGRTIQKAWYAYAEWNWGPQRADKERAKGGRKAARFFEDWSSAHDWQSRARAWDRHLEKIAQRKAEQAHLDQLEEHRSHVQEFADDARETAATAKAQIDEALSDMSLEEASVKEVASLIRATTDLYKAALEAESHALGVDEVVRALAAEGRLLDD